MQSWITKESPWVYWVKYNGSYVKIDNGNVFDGRITWDTCKSAKILVTSCPSFFTPIEKKKTNMKIIQKYQSDDCKEFNTEAECVKHERDVAMQKAEAKIKAGIKSLVHNWCESYSDDYDSYNENAVAEFICKHFEEISDIINKESK